ncbi:MAG: transketolase C-terminal domain-containing protein [Acidobacteriota bacterium]|nr:transketolase C-terminal domain-containing protein [Acidobacteriota bacterium]
MTLATWGGMAHLAHQAAREAAIEYEKMVEVVVLSRLAPLDPAPLLASVRRTGALVVAEEGTLSAGVGAEIVARVQEEAFAALRGPVKRVAARDRVIPAARHLEDAVLPQVEEILHACLAAAGAES